MIIRGVVERGRGLGHTIGFPTANVAIGQGVAIEMGVYRSRVVVLDREYDAVTHVGTNPTVGGNALRSESYIYDFDADIYDQTVSVELLDFIRGEETFSSVEALVEQISRDVQRVKAMCI